MISKCPACRGTFDAPAYYDDEGSCSHSFHNPSRLPSSPAGDSELDMSKVCLCENYADPNCKVCFPDADPLGDISGPKGSGGSGPEAVCGYQNAFGTAAYEDWQRRSAPEAAAVSESKTLDVERAERWIAENFWPKNFDEMTPRRLAELLHDYSLTVAAPIAPAAQDDELMGELTQTVEMALAFFYSPTSFHVPEVEKRYESVLRRARAGLRKVAAPIASAEQELGRYSTVYGATAVICAVMPNGCRAGYVEECSMPTGWTEDGKEISGRYAYDLTARAERKEGEAKHEQH